MNINWRGFEIIREIKHTREEIYLLLIFAATGVILALDAQYATTINFPQIMLFLFMENRVLI